MIFFFVKNLVKKGSKIQNMVIWVRGTNFSGQHFVINCGSFPPFSGLNMNIKHTLTFLIYLLISVRYILFRLEL